MRTTLLAVTALAIVSVMSAGCVSKGAYMKSLATADSLEQELRALKTRHAALEGEHARLMAARNELERDLSAKAGDMGMTIVDLRQRISALESDNARLVKENAASAAENARLVKENAASAAENARLASEKAQLASESSRLASDNARLARDISETQKAREEKVREVSSTYEQLLEKMKGEIARGQVTISELKGKLTVNMVEAILFDSGKADVKPGGLAVLAKVVDILKTVHDKAIRIEGHTDNVEIAPALAQRYPTNWELSAARAINVARYLQKQAVEADSLSASAFGQFRPVADNSTAVGRAKNRRIEIVLVPKD